MGGEILQLSKLNDSQLVKYVEYQISKYAETHEKMIIGKSYYKYEHDVDRKMRVVIGHKGKLKPVYNLPNQRVKDNQYARAVDQKVNYLFSKTPNINCDDENVVNYLTEFMNKSFIRVLNYIAIDSYNCGIGWLFLYTDGKEIKFKKVSPDKIVPIWSDDSHEKLEGVILSVSKEEFEGDTLVTKNYIYLYTKDAIKTYKYDNGYLEHVEDNSYLTKGDKAYSYGKIPFVYFKMPMEQALISRVKCLQDALNVLVSNYADGMLENPGNSIMIIKNYDGEDLGEFRQNLATDGAVKVRTADGSQGGIDTLEIKVNAENYKIIIELLKKAIAQNARSLYLDNDRTTQAPNSLNIKSMYSDMELDANALELEFTASFEYLFKFINQITKMNIKNCEISFKRNIMVNDESNVEMIKNSIGIVSDETLRANHPFVNDLELEEQRIKKQKDEQLKSFDDYAVGDK